MKLFYNWHDYWLKRKTDWKGYLNTWNVPHRSIIVQILNGFAWRSLWEVGCGSGPNILRIYKDFPDRELGGSDINPEAIEMAKATFKGAPFEVSPADNVCMSDRACDVILTDMTLIYISPRKIKKVLKEFKRMARNRVILVEFNSSSFWQRLKLKIIDGYSAFDYKPLLKKCGFFDILIYKIPVQFYPDADNNQRKFATIISARI